MEDNKKVLYDWMFWYNYYESQWYGIHRNTVVEFFSGIEGSRYFRADSIESVMNQIRESILPN